MKREIQWRWQNNKKYSIRENTNKLGNKSKMKDWIKWDISQTTVKIKTKKKNLMLIIYNISFSTNKV